MYLKWDFVKNERKSITSTNSADIGRFPTKLPGIDKAPSVPESLGSVESSSNNSNNIATYTEERQQLCNKQNGQAPNSPALSNGNYDNLSPGKVDVYHPDDLESTAEVQQLLEQVDDVIGREFSDVLHSGPQTFQQVKYLSRLCMILRFR